MSSQTRNEATILEAANEYSKKGWRVLALHSMTPDGCSCGRQNCSSAGKHPVDAKWQAQPALSGPDLYARFEEEGRNLGLATGANSGFWVLDVDLDKPGTQEAFDALLAANTPLPDTFAVRTGGGGLQFYFAMPDFNVTNSAKRLPEHIDVRGTGGQVVAAPSISGKGQYSVLADHDVVRAPAWLEELVRPLPPAAPVDLESLPKNTDLPADEQRRLQGYTDMVVKAELARLEECREKGWHGPHWNQTTFEVACNLLELANSPWCPLTRQEAHTMVISDAPRDNGFTTADVEACFTSALKTTDGQGRALPAKKNEITIIPGDPLTDPNYQEKDEIMATVTPIRGTSPTKPKGKPRAGADEDSQADTLIAIAQSRYEFRQDEKGDDFAISLEGPRIARTLKGAPSLQSELAYAYYEAEGKVPNQKALSATMNVLQALCYRGGRVPVSIRVGEAEGSQWLDMGTVDGRVIKVNGEGWSVEPAAPITFRRTELSSPLPEPVQGGSFDHLWEVANVNEADRALLLAVLVSELFPNIDHPVTFLQATHGAGKSTATAALANVVDPTAAPLRKPPRDEEAWTTVAPGSYAIAVDNVSTIPAWWSDSLCRASTGDGDVKRKLYTDNSLMVFSFRSCVFINGIDLSGIRDDLASRAVNIKLDSLEGRRLRKSDIEANWKRSHPEILGALLDLVVKVINTLPTIELDDPPRMMDFAYILAAVDKVLGTDGLTRYSSLADDMATESVSTDPVIQALMQDLGHLRAPFVGTSAELLHKLNDGRWINQKQPEDWPTSAKAMAGFLRRKAPVLEHIGWKVEDIGRGGKHKLLRWQITPAPRDDEYDALV